MSFLDKIVELFSGEDKIAGKYSKMNSDYRAEVKKGEAQLKRMQSQFEDAQKATDEAIELAQKQQSIAARMVTLSAMYEEAILNYADAKATVSIVSQACKAEITDARKRVDRLSSLTEEQLMCLSEVEVTSDAVMKQRQKIRNMAAGSQPVAQPDPIPQPQSAIPPVPPQVVHNDVPPDNGGVSLGRTSIIPKA